MGGFWGAGATDPDSPGQLWGHRSPPSASRRMKGGRGPPPFRGVRGLVHLPTKELLYFSLGTRGLATSDLSDRAPVGAACTSQHVLGGGRAALRPVRGHGTAAAGRQRAPPRPGRRGAPHAQRRETPAVNEPTPTPPRTEKRKPPRHPAAGGQARCRCPACAYTHGSAIHRACRPRHVKGGKWALSGGEQ